MQNLLRLEESLPLYIPLEIIKLITYFADEIVFDLDNTHNDLDLLERNIVKVKETEIGGGYYRVYLKSYYGKALYEYEILNIHFSSDIWYNRAIGLTKTMDRLNGWVSCDKDDLWCLDSTFDENHLMSISNSCIDMLGSFREELDLHIMVKSFIFQINKKKKVVRLIDFETGKVVYKHSLEKLDLTEFYICLVIHKENNSIISIA